MQSFDYGPSFLGFIILLISEDGSETYKIKKGRLSLNLRPTYSKDRIHKATERIIEEQKEQSKDS